MIYRGRIEISHNPEVKVDIDDLDSATWHGTVDPVVGPGENWKPGRVTVRLLDGSRAGAVADADVDVAAHVVSLAGRTPFRVV